MSAGFHHSSSSGHLHSHTKTPTSSEIEANLYELGLLGNRTKKKPSKAKAKIVEFRSPVAHHSSFRTHSRTSNRSADTLKPFSSHSLRSTSTLGSTAPPRSSRGMAGMLDIERARTRRERTFIGSECAVCEEPLEHTLRGERILQLSCGHVSHEACFYEYIREFESQHCPTCNATLGLDTSRGGNVLDLEKLSTIVRSVQLNDSREPARTAQSTPTPWDAQTASDRTRPRNDSDPSGRYQPSHPRDQRQRDSSHSRERSERMGSSMSRQHIRSDSGATGVASSGDYADTHNGRRHDYDVQSMETSLSSPRGLLKSPIPAPTVTVRSEFPTLSRSRQQQSLTCLVTVEVVEGKWRPEIGRAHV